MARTFITRDIDAFVKKGFSAWREWDGQNDLSGWTFGSATITDNWHIEEVTVTTGAVTVHCQQLNVWVDVLVYIEETPTATSVTIGIFPAVKESLDAHQTVAEYKEATREPFVSYLTEIAVSQSAVGNLCPSLHKIKGGNAPTEDERAHIVGCVLCQRDLVPDEAGHPHITAMVQEHLQRIAGEGEDEPPIFEIEFTV